MTTREDEDDGGQEQDALRAKVFFRAGLSGLS